MSTLIAVLIVGLIGLYGLWTILAMLRCYLCDAIHTRLIELGKADRARVDTLWAMTGRVWDWRFRRFFHQEKF